MIFGKKASNLRPPSKTRAARAQMTILKGSWDLVTRVIIKVTILITPVKVLITILTKSHDPPSILEP